MHLHSIEPARFGERGRGVAGWGLLEQRSKKIEEEKEDAEQQSKKGHINTNIGYPESNRFVRFCCI